MPSLADKTREELLKIAPGELPRTSAAIISQIEQLEAKVEWFEEQHRLALHRQFGTSSEQTPAGQEALLFNEAEVVAEAPVQEPELENISYTRRKVKGKREVQLANLPVKETEYRLPEEEQVCPQCAGRLHEMGTEVRHEVETVPATVFIRKHIRYKYACRHCQREEITTPVLVAPMPAPAFPNSLASPSSVAHIMTEKFVMGSPLYRQEQQFARHDFQLSRQTMANWMIRGAGWLETMYESLRQTLLAGDIIHADETTLQVLREPGRAAQADSWAWLYRTGREGPPIVLFEYQPGRGGQYPKRFLGDFNGHLQVDGHGAYDGLSDKIILVGCWAHARRKFTDALKALPTAKKLANSKSPPTAQVGLDYCNKVFAIERELHDVTPQERLNGRLARTMPVLEQFKIWLDAQSNATLPKSALGVAITYCRNQWPKLIEFLNDGRLEVDNNRAERSIKPFVIGRKNWLFANTPKGAKASTIIYSIIETAKENGLNPFAYLEHLFKTLPNIDTGDSGDVANLLPWAEDIRLQCCVRSRR
jgi:transposase